MRLLHVTVGADTNAHFCMQHRRGALRAPAIHGANSLFQIYIHDGYAALRNQQLKGVLALGVGGGCEAEFAIVGKFYRQHGELADIFHFPNILTNHMTLYMNTEMLS